MKNKSALKDNGEKVAYASDLDYKAMKALIKTLGEDEHVLIHKLEIRYRATTNNYRVITRVVRIENPEHPSKPS